MTRLRISGNFLLAVAIYPLYANLTVTLPLSCFLSISIKQTIKTWPDCVPKPKGPIHTQNTDYIPAEVSLTTKVGTTPAAMMQTQYIAVGKIAFFFDIPPQTTRAKNSKNNDQKTNISMRERRA